MLKPRKRMGLVFFPAFDWAISPNHPEREERLLYTQDQVFEEGLLDIEGIIEYKPGLATAADINRVHICVPDALGVVTALWITHSRWFVRRGTMQCSLSTAPVAFATSTSKRS